MAMGWCGGWPWWRVRLMVVAVRSRWWRWWLRFDGGATLVWWWWRCWQCGVDCGVGYGDGEVVMVLALEEEVDK